MKKKENSQGLIALLTDFGWEDTYVGLMKAVIYSILPGAAIVDLCHQIGQGNIAQGSMMLADGYSYFPENSVFCVVVDPGVGSERKPLCIRSEHYWFVGPDNGILWQAAERDGICSIFHLDNKGLFLEKVSNTFHGRDVFAPVCARLLKQKATYQPGSRIDECVQYVIPCIKKSENGFEISVVHVDHFGNLVLNIMHKEFLGITTGSSFRFDIGKACVTQIFTHYSQAPDGAPFFISGSSSRMEISIKNADASEQLGVRINQKGNLITF